MQPAVFYPLSIIYYLFPFDRAFNYFLIFHVFLGGIFIYALARDWGYGVSASLISGVTFMFSGFTVSVINMPTTLSSMIWLPLIFLFFAKALKGAAHHVLLSGTILAVMFLGGEPSVFYFAVIGLFLYTAVFVVCRTTRLSVQAFAGKAMIFLFVVALSLLLAAFQLIPFLELLVMSDRPFVVRELTSAWSLSLRDTVNFIIPYFFGAQFSPDTVWKTQSWVPVIYGGTFTLLLVVMALLFKRDWKTRFIFLLAVIFLFLSYGTHTPFYGLASKVVPGFGLIRYPARFLVIVNFCLALLCGAGYDAYAKGLAGKRKDMKAFFAFLLLVIGVSSAIFIVLFIYPERILAAAKDFFAVRFAHGDARTAFITAAADMINVRRFLGLFVIGAMVLYLAMRTRVRGAVAHCAFVALVSIDFFSATSGLQYTSRRELFHRTPPTVEFLERDKGLFRFYVSPMAKDKNAFLNVDPKEYGQSLLEAKDRLCANRMMENGLYDARGYESIKLMDYIKYERLVDSMGLPACARLLDLINVKYVATLNEIGSQGYELVMRGRLYLYKNKHVLPRAFLVSSSIVLKREKDIADRLKAKEFDPAREVILEEEPGQRNRSQVTGHRSHDSGQGQEERVGITKYIPHEVVIEVLTTSPKFLVLSDKYYPGWKAFVDGKRTRIYKADFIVRTVHIDSPGRHIVRFVYDPFSFKCGCAISFMTLIVVLILNSHRSRAARP